MTEACTLIGCFALLAVICAPELYLYDMEEKSEGREKVKYRRIKAAYEIFCVVAFFTVVIFMAKGGN